MQEFNRQQSTTRFIRRPVWLAGLAIILVGGGAFAASGGVQRLKNWLIKVHIGDQTIELNTDANGQATYTTQTEDGRQAVIHVQKNVDAAGGDATTVHVNVDGDSRNEEQVAKIVRRVARADDNEPSKYTMADLGDSEPVYQWTDGQGHSRALYLIDGEDGGPTQVFLATTGTDGAVVVRMLIALPEVLNLAGIKPEVSVDDSGMVTLTFDRGDGNHQVIKLRTAVHADGESLDQPIRIQAGDGKIGVEIQPSEGQPKE